MNTLILLVGASGSGKSTTRKRLVEENPALQVFSWDELRLKLGAPHVPNYDSLDSESQYKAAWDYCNENRSKFDNYQRKIFAEMLNKGDVLIDNTNTSAKGRAQFIDVAKAKGFRIVAYLFPITKDELIKRANARTDHKVPIPAVISQWRGLQLPGAGPDAEVDEVKFVIDGKEVA